MMSYSNWTPMAYIMSASNSPSPFYIVFFCVANVAILREFNAVVSQPYMVGWFFGLPVLCLTLYRMSHSMSHKRKHIVVANGQLGIQKSPHLRDCKPLLAFRRLSSLPRSKQIPAQHRHQPYLHVKMQHSYASPHPTIDSIVPPSFFEPSESLSQPSPTSPFAAYHFPRGRRSGLIPNCLVLRLSVLHGYTGFSVCYGHCRGRHKRAKCFGGSC
jgi:hypothetical protein